MQSDKQVFRSCYLITFSSRELLLDRGYALVWSIRSVWVLIPPNICTMTSSFPTIMNNDSERHIHLARRASAPSAKTRRISSFTSTWCMGNGGAGEQTEHGVGSRDLIQRRIFAFHRPVDKIKSFPTAAPATLLKTRAKGSLLEAAYPTKCSGARKAQRVGRRGVGGRLSHKEPSEHHLRLHICGRSYKAGSLSTHAPP